MRGFNVCLSSTVSTSGLCALMLALGCGDSGGSGTTSTGATETSTSSSTTAPSTTVIPTSSDGTTDGNSVSGSASTTDGPAPTSTTVEPTSTSSTTEPISETTTAGETNTGETTTADETTTTTTTDPETSDTTTFGDPPCVEPDVPDTLAFTYSKTIDLSPISVLQASFYNQDAQEIVFLGLDGAGRRYSLDGTPLGNVMAPPEALPLLDGASFDQVKRVGLLITQNCTLVEVDPVTLETLAVLQLDKVELGLNTCAGVAIGVDGNMYITSYFTDEIVVMTRDGQTELDRIDLAAVGLPRPDGITLIAGSENFLVLSTDMILSGIVSPAGEILVGPAKTGKDKPPLIGGITNANPDAVLTVCGNGHAWVCDESGIKCHEYVPMDGDKNTCTCTIP